MSVTQSQAWKALEEHFQEDILPHTLKQLFHAAGSERFEQLSVADQGLLLDLSKQRLTPKTLELLIQLAQQQGLSDAIENLYAGGLVNPSELRPALHTALRGTQGQQAPAVA